MEVKKIIIATRIALLSFVIYYNIVVIPSAYVCKCDSYIIIIS